MRINEHVKSSHLFEAKLTVLKLKHLNEYYMFLPLLKIIIVHNALCILCFIYRALFNFRACSIILLQWFLFQCKHLLLSTMRTIRSTATGHRQSQPKVGLYQAAAYLFTCNCVKWRQRTPAIHLNWSEAQYIYATSLIWA